MDPLLRKVGRVEAAGGRVLSWPEDIPVGRVAVVADPFGNPLVLLDLSKGTFQTGPDGTVTGVG
jgi:predicted enzyme related to lactoylglutathione lyase